MSLVDYAAAARKRARVFPVFRWQPGLWLASANDSAGGGGGIFPGAVHALQSR